MQDKMTCRVRSFQICTLSPIFVNFLAVLLLVEQLPMISQFKIPQLWVAYIFNMSTKYHTMLMLFYFSSVLHLDMDFFTLSVCYITRRYNKWPYGTEAEMTCDVNCMNAQKNGWNGKCWIISGVHMSLLRTEDDCGSWPLTHALCLGVG